jgi:hypothetical protein
MGIGFRYVVDPPDAERTLAILKAHGRAASASALDLTEVRASDRTIFWLRA